MSSSWCPSKTVSRYRLTSLCGHHERPQPHPDIGDAPPPGRARLLNVTDWLPLIVVVAAGRFGVCVFWRLSRE